jgi:hypothetical protein
LSCRNDRDAVRPHTSTSTDAGSTLFAAIIRQRGKGAISRRLA